MWRWLRAGGWWWITGATASNCVLTARECLNFPQFRQTQFRDNSKTARNLSECIKRAEDFHNWCGNDKDAQVAATYDVSMQTQIYRPSVCDPGWSQFDSNCYIHIWDVLNWFDAEKACRELGGHLASIHSEEENNFLHQLTKGLSAWIGYNTVKKKEETAQWSDSTAPDFSNWSKNCTNREHEPGCAPEEKAQQWYDWDGEDKGTYVCKKQPLKPIDFVVTKSLEEIWESNWELLDTAADEDTVPLALDAAAASAAEISAAKKLKEKEVLPEAKKGVAAPAVGAKGAVGVLQSVLR